MNNKKFIEKLLLNFLNKLSLDKELIEELIIKDLIKELTIRKLIKKLIKKLIDYLSIEEIIKFIK